MSTRKKKLNSIWENHNIRYSLQLSPHLVVHNYWPTMKTRKQKQMTENQGKKKENKNRTTDHSDSVNRNGL